MPHSKAEIETTKTAPAAISLILPAFSLKSGLTKSTMDSIVVFIISKAITNPTQRLIRLKI